MVDDVRQGAGLIRAACATAHMTRNSARVATARTKRVGENGLTLLYTCGPLFAVLKVSVSFENTFINLPGRLSMDL